jgi:hypothetical protein
MKNTKQPQQKNQSKEKETKPKETVPEMPFDEFMQRIMRVSHQEVKIKKA